MRLIDFDQTVFVPLVDESKGGVKYEVQMTIAEVFEKFFDGVQPEIIDAIPVEWLNERHRKCCEDVDTDLMDAITVLCNEYHVWQEEQEAR